MPACSMIGKSGARSVAKRQGAARTLAEGPHAPVVVDGRPHGRARDERVVRAELGRDAAKVRADVLNRARHAPRRVKVAHEVQRAVGGEVPLAPERVQLLLRPLLHLHRTDAE